MSQSRPLDPAAGHSRWLAQDLPHRLEKHYGLPLIHVVGEAYTFGA